MSLLKKLTFGLAVLLIAGCTDLDELLENPNGVDPSEAGSEFLFNSIQIKTAEILMGDNQNAGDAVQTGNTLYDFTSGLSRMTALTTGFTYQAAQQPGNFDAMWTDVYADLFPDIETLISIDEPLGIDGPVAAAKILEAYVLMIIADNFGDAPLPAVTITDEPVDFNRSAASGEEIYAFAIALLDEAIAQLDGADAFPNQYQDLFYNGNPEAWSTLAQTLKIRAAVTTRLVEGAGGVAAINQAVEAGIIDANSKNWEYRYGNNRSNPSNRHPLYVETYEADDGGYQSNWYMWLLNESKGFQDPRTRYYFYRKTNDILTVVAGDPNAFDCILTDVPDADFTPDHYAEILDDMPYCLGSYSDGYFGRDHLNGSGIPPDGQYRTVAGLYPAGGKYDNSTDFEDIQNSGVDGALGEGIIPMMQASYTHFLLAEAALTMGYEGDASALLRTAIELSMERVTDFEELVDAGEIIASVPVEVRNDATFVSDSVITEYIDFVMDNFDGADDGEKLNILATESLIALYGNGWEAYNLYRRTCRPNFVQPGIDPNYGQFIRSFFYPTVYVELNSLAEQKTDLLQPVFWDTNDGGCAY